jgi:hypothetical protein
MLKLKKITDSIVLVSANTQSELNQTFLRPQEYYESSEFQGKIFTLGQYRKWYAEKNGGFTYLTDWSGFNLPSKAFEPFIQGLFDPLLPGEQQLVDWLKDRKDKYAIIAAQPDGDALEHELCHALWATNDEYQKRCSDIIDDWRATSPNEYAALKTWILECGYNESVIQDECHAYISADRDWLLDKKGVFVDEAWQTMLRIVKDCYYQHPKNFKWE